MRLVTLEVGVLSLIGSATAATFLFVSVVRGFDPVSAIAAFVAIAVTEYVVRGNRTGPVRRLRDTHGLSY